MKKYLLLILLLFFSCSKKELTINFVGDLMCVPSIRGYDTNTMLPRLNRMLFNVTPILRNADLTIGNLESPVSHHNPIIKSLRFNAPRTYLDALTNAGFDIVSFANNHTCDQGEDGILDTILNLDKYNIKFVGVDRFLDNNRNLYIVKNGYRLTFIAYTYGLNGNISGKEHVNVAGHFYKCKASILNDIRYARLNSDFIILMLHWGVEYSTNYERWQKELAKEFIYNGVDVIIGTHPHVPQPIEKINNGIVAYSLGNFIGAKITPPESLQGKILQLSIKNNKIEIKKIYHTQTIISGTIENRIFDIILHNE